jgi:hypothetical protein
MLMRRQILDAIEAGSVTAVYRRWERPRVRVGTRMRTAVGLVEVTGVERVEEAALTDADARTAGERDRDAVLGAQPDRAAAGQPLWRVGLRHAGADPRIALREDGDLDAAALAEITEALARIDRRTRRGPWTREVLELIDRRPEILAAELAAELGRDTQPFKADVRRLKELGLTESLETGYRLSPRGRAVLSHLSAR